MKDIQKHNVWVKIVREIYKIVERERKNQNVKNVLTHPVGDVELRVAGEDVDSITVENVVKVVTIHCLYLVTYLSIIQNIIIKLSIQNNLLSCLCKDRGEKG